MNISSLSNDHRNSGHLCHLPRQEAPLHAPCSKSRSPKVPEPGALSGPDGIDGSSDLISSPLEKHRRELTNTIAGRGNEGRGRGEDSEEAEELLEHLDGLLRIRRCGCGKATTESLRKVRVRRGPSISVSSVSEDRLQQFLTFTNEYHLVPITHYISRARACLLLRSSFSHRGGTHPELSNRPTLYTDKVDRLP